MNENITTVDTQKKKKFMGLLPNRQLRISMSMFGFLRSGMIDL